MATSINDSQPVKPQRSRLRTAIVVSVLVHVFLIVALVVWYVRKDEPPSRNDNQELATATTEQSAEQPPSSMVVTSQDGAKSPVLSDDVIEMQVEKVAEQYEGLSDEQKVNALGEKLQELDEIASEESIEQVTATLEQAVGSDRATQPAEEPVDGDFDFNTAQLHDVKRTKADDGSWQYHSVLLDAKGRTFEAELDAAAGKTTYDTMQQLKAFPFADQIYRRLAMPVIDNVMAAQRAADEAAAAAKKKESAETTTEPDVEQSNSTSDVEE